jgi:hypothetical protein
MARLVFLVFLFLFFSVGRHKIWADIACLPLPARIPAYREREAGQYTVFVVGDR